MSAGQWKYPSSWDPPNPRQKNTRKNRILSYDGRKPEKRVGILRSYGFVISAPSFETCEEYTDMTAKRWPGISKTSAQLTKTYANNKKHPT